MILHILKNAINEFKTNSGVTLINFVGFTLAISACILVGLYIKHNISYDKFNERAENIYRLNYFQNKKDFHSSMTNHQWAKVLQEEIPEVELATCFTPWQNEKTIKVGQNEFKVIGEWGDKNLFRVFSFPFLEGNEKTVFANPNSIAISKSLAHKLFGKNKVIGERIEVEHNEEYFISAVFEDIPQNSSIRFDFLLDIGESQGSNTHWLSWGWQNFVLLKNNTNPRDVAAKMKDLQKKHISEWHSNDFDYTFQPLLDIHFNSQHLQGSNLSDMKKTNIYVFGSIGLVILLIACFNFINLTIVGFQSRETDVKIRKLLGANRSSLFVQFMAYSTMLTTLCLILAVLISELAQPLLEKISGDVIRLPFNSIVFWCIVLVGGIALGVITGIFPSVRLSGKRAFQKDYANHTFFSFRSILMVFQFVAIIGLLSFVGMVKKQLNFSTTGDLGYNYSNVVQVVGSENIYKKHKAFESEISKIAGVVATTSANFVLPSHFGNFGGAKPGGAEKSIDIYHGDIAPNFFEVMGVPLYKSSPVLRPSTSKQVNNVIINKQAYNDFGIGDNILNNSYKYHGNTCKVEGIVEDFHYYNMKEKMKPIAFHLAEKGWIHYIRIEANTTRSVLKELEKTYLLFEKNRPFTYMFVDKMIGAMYEKETKLFQLISVFFGLAIFIAMIGLIGMVKYLTIYKTKEIGIRKVNGAKVSEVLTMLNKDFIKWVFIAFFIAVPLAWYAVNKWLENFAYKTTLSWWIFVLAGMLALGIALLTVSWQSWRAATRNPVEALRYE